MFGLTQVIGRIEETIPEVDEFTKALWHFNGEVGTQSFPDASGNGHTATAYNGGPVISNENAVFNQALKLQAAGGLSVPASDDFMFDGDFCIDFRANIGGFNIGYACFIDAYTSPRAGAHCTATSLLTFGLTLPWTPSLNTWYHIALTRSGTNFRAFINGVQLGDTKTLTGTIPAGEFIIGAAYNTTVPMTGYLDEMRISKGTPRWTEDFTLPTSEY